MYSMNASYQLHHREDCILASPFELAVIPSKLGLSWGLTWHGRPLGSLAPDPPVVTGGDALQDTGEASWPGLQECARWSLGRSKYLMAVENPKQ